VISDVDAILLAVGEATSNVAVHAYGAAGGALHFRAVIAGERVEIEVRDDGRWRPPLDDHGQGLQIIGQMSEAMDVAAGPDGTTVTFGRRVGRGQPS
jgi:anti-sigma regulatory factor (Ser/Thr protein kinase)